MQCAGPRQTVAHMEMLFSGTERIKEYKPTNSNALGYVGIKEINAVSRDDNCKNKIYFYNNN
jgi:hypothetical protein